MIFKKKPSNLPKRSTSIKQSPVLKGHHFPVAYNRGSQNCIKRSLLRQRKNGHLRPVTSLKRFNSYEIFYDGNNDFTVFFLILRFHVYLKLAISLTGMIFKKNQSNLPKRSTSHTKYSMMEKERGVLLRQVTSLKRLNSYEIFYYEEEKVDLLKKERPKIKRKVLSLK
jgi:hypothetical protein